MIIASLKKVKMPAIYISISFLLGSLCYGIYSYNKGLAVITAGLFIMFIILKTNFTFSLVLLILFFLQIFNCYNYYNGMNLNKRIKLTIAKNNEYACEGSIDKRKVYIECDEKDLPVGSVILVDKYDFLQEADINRGIVGIITVKSYEIKQTLIRWKCTELRNEIFEKIEENIGTRKASLISSLSFGDKKRLDEEDKEDMKVMGIVHATCVSGLHVSLEIGRAHV